MATGIDLLLNLISEEQIDYKSNELFGLIAFIGKKQQIHVRGYRDGRIEAEIEPFVQHIEHTKQHENSRLFHGFWYSSLNTIIYLLELASISFAKIEGDNGNRYSDVAWNKFSQTNSTRNLVFQQANYLFGRKYAIKISKEFEKEVRQIKTTKISKLLKKALKKDGFISQRK